MNDRLHQDGNAEVGRALLALHDYTAVIEMMSPAEQELHYAVLAEPINSLQRHRTPGAAW